MATVCEEQPQQVQENNLISKDENYEDNEQTSNLSLIERELLDFDAQRMWNAVFKRVKNEASEESRDLTYNVALKPENRYRNRYRDVIPYDHTRVKLQSPQATMLTKDQLRDFDESDEGEDASASFRGTSSDIVYSDYINASHVQLHSRSYILTQGPLPATQAHFWLMVLENRCPAVIMLNRLVEKGALKCSPYFPTGPEDGDEDFCEYEDAGLRVFLLSTENHGFYLQRRYRVDHTPSGSSQECVHFHYLAWPDFGVPHNPSAFLNFLFAVRRAGVFSSSGPVVVHCSAGVGRSGTFVLVDVALLMAEESGSLESVNLRSLLVQLRSQRMGLIQTWEQLRFSYLALIQAARALLPITSSAERDSFWFTVPPEDCGPPQESSEEEDWDESEEEDEDINIEVDEETDPDKIYPYEDLGGEVPASEEEAEVFQHMRDFEPPAVVEEEVRQPEDVEENLVETNLNSHNMEPQSSLVESRVVENASLRTELEPAPDVARVFTWEEIREEQGRVREERRLRTRQMIVQMQARLQEQALQRHRWLPYWISRRLPNTPYHPVVYFTSAMLLAAVAWLMVGSWTSKFTSRNDGPAPLP